MQKYASKSTLFLRGISFEDNPVNICLFLPFWEKCGIRFVHVTAVNG